MSPRVAAGPEGTLPAARRRRTSAARPGSRQWEGAPPRRRVPWLLLVLAALLVAGAAARLATVSGGGLEIDHGEDGEAAPGTEVAEGTGAAGGQLPEAPWADGSWTSVPDPPVTWVRPPSIVWTGRFVLVWGAGIDGAVGAAFDRPTRTWNVLPEAPLGARDGHVAVWTGRASDPSGAGEMIVWGGRPLHESPSEAAGGAAYDPVARRWRLIAESPMPVRAGAPAAWTGTQLVVAAAPGAGAQPAGAAYDPVEDDWEAFPRLPPDAWLDALTWTGSETLALLGQPGRRSEVPVAAWDRDRGAWSPRPSAPLGVATSTSTPAGGAGGFVWLRAADGAGRLALLDRDTDRWTVTARAPLTDRTAPSLLWTGRRVIVWGGADVTGRLADGALYHLVERRWLRIDGGSQEVARPLAAVWAGDEMIVVGYRGRDRRSVAAASWAPP